MWYSDRSESFVIIGRIFRIDVVTRRRYDHLWKDYLVSSIKIHPLVEGVLSLR